MDNFEELRKKYQRDNLIKLGSQAREIAAVYPTGSITLDTALEVGGIPGGRETMLYGPPSGGKTTVALCTMGQLHRASSDAFVGYIDLENALDFNYAEKCGVDLDRLYVSNPEWAEQAFDVAESMIRSGQVHIVVVDSIPALAARAEMEGAIGDAHVALGPRLISQFLRRITFPVMQSQVAVIFINQIRDKISTMPYTKKEPPGGWMLKHMISVSISMRNAGAITHGDEFIGSNVEFKIEKNKVGTPFKTGSFQIWSDRGVCVEADILAAALRTGTIAKKGSWYSFDGNVIAQGETATIAALSNKELLNQIKERIKQHEENV